MKVETSETKQFVPCSMTIIFENQTELDLFGSVFNSFNICEVLKANGFGEAYKFITDRAIELGGDISKYTMKFKGI